MLTLQCPICDPTPHSTPHVLHLTRHSRPLHYTIAPASSESKEIERVGGYQFTVTQMPNSFAFGGGNVPASFQWPHRMGPVLPSLLHVLCGTISYTFCHVILWRCLTWYTCQRYYCIPHVDVNVLPVTTWDGTYPSISPSWVLCGSP